MADRGGRRRPESRHSRRERRRRRRSIVQRRVRSPRVVLHSPLLYHHLRFFQRVENLPIQTLISQLPVKTFAVAVLPRASGFNVQRPGSYLAQPLPQLLGHELWSVSRETLQCYHPFAICNKEAVPRGCVARQKCKWPLWTNILGVVDSAAASDSDWFASP
jgi:hypothetical protein